MNRETVHSVKEKSMYSFCTALQLNTDVKERTNEEGLMNHRKGEKKKKKKREREREREKDVETSRPACN